MVLEMTLGKEGDDQLGEGAELTRRDTSWRVAASRRHHAGK